MKNPFGKRKARMHPIRIPIATAVRTFDLRREWALLFLINGPSRSLRPIIGSNPNPDVVVFWLQGFENIWGERVNNCKDDQG